MLRFLKISKFSFEATSSKEPYRPCFQDHNEASFPCPQCTHLAKSKLRLTKHIYDTHKKSERTNIKRPKPSVRPVCDICGTSFSNTTSLSTHIKGEHYIYCNLLL